MSNENDLNLKLDLLLLKIKDLEEKIEKIDKSSDRMIDHINFIERIYETLKKPIHYISYAFNYGSLKYLN